MYRQRHLIILATLSIATITACGGDELSSSDRWDITEIEQPPTTTPPKEDPPKKDPPKMPDVPDPPIIEQDNRFVGRWVVHDNVPRGGITADIFHFHEDGRLELLQQFDPGGVVVRCDLNDEGCMRGAEVVRCVFGEQWHSEGTTKLFVEGACSDDKARTLAFEFPEDASGNATTVAGAAAVLVAVDGQTEGWSAASFHGPAPALYFKKCAEDRQCPLH